MKKQNEVILTKLEGEEIWKAMNDLRVGFKFIYRVLRF